MKRWSRAAALALLLVGAGCSEGAKLIQESDSGGVVTYPFKGENGYLYSRFRTEAYLKEYVEGLNGEPARLPAVQSAGRLVAAANGRLQ